MVKTIASEMTEPGIYKGLSFDDYAAIKAVNSQILSAFEERTPAHVYHEMQTGGLQRTPALDLGWYLHMAVLEPKRFESEAVIAPRVDKRTKKGQAIWDQFEAEHAGKYILDEPTYEKTKAMADALLNHETAGPFLRGSAENNELVIVWQDQATGVLCKGRLDRLDRIGERIVNGDIKTARSASHRSIEKSIYQYGYYIQGAHYLDGLETLYPTGNPMSRGFILFVVESSPPYCCACYEVDDVALEEGAEARTKYLHRWKQCTDSGHWPGYPAGIQYASLPAWVMKRFVD